MSSKSKFLHGITPMAKRAWIAAHNVIVENRRKTNRRLAEERTAMRHSRRLAKEGGH